VLDLAISEEEEGSRSVDLKDEIGFNAEVLKVKKNGQS